MSDLDKHVDTFARAVATLGMEQVTPVTLLSFCGPRNIESVALMDAFVERFSAWHGLPYDKGVALVRAGSAHARMAWQAFAHEVRAAEEVAP